jgi:anion-transporting  ArsA/GET3 family ATPase
MPRRRGMREDLAEALSERRVLVICGSGGVGKTTAAAALGLHAALEGRRVLVCTIDPSRRLATSLGLAQLKAKPRAIDLRRFSPAAGGSLSAMILDTKSTFDALVTRYAADEASRKRILENRFYAQVSAALAGSHEYMAMEKLLELSADERFELIVLDTPPTRQALDFLEAPDRLLSFLDTGILRFFLKPYFVAGRLTFKIATRAGAMAFKLVDRFLGLQFLQDLSEFFLAFEGMYDGFKERAARVHALLRDPSSGFVLVAGPSSQALDEALYFHRRLREQSMPFVGSIVNRVHPDPAQEVPLDPAKQGRLDRTQEGPARRTARPPREKRLYPDLAGRLAEVFRDQQTLARVEAKRVDRLEVESGARPIVVPEFEQDVHDLRGLSAVAEAIFAGAGPASRARRHA